MKRKTKTTQILAMLMAVAVVLPAGADYWSAVDAYERGEYEAARKELEPLAAAGDAKSQVRLGLMYREGRGAPRDPKRAFSWLLKAAKQGRADAQFLVGTMYRRGEGTMLDEDAGLAWLRRSAAQGNPKAADAIAQVDAARTPAGSAAAAARRGGAGDEVQTATGTDPNTARRLAETEAVLAAMDPPASAAEIAAINKAAAHGVRVRYGSLSTEAAQAAADAEEAPTGLNFKPSSAPASMQDVMARHGEPPRGPVVELKDTDARAGAVGASAAGTVATGAQANVAATSPDSVAALQQRATQGDRVAQRRLAAAYLDGKEVQRDPVRAAQWYRKAALQGDAESQFVLSGMYYRGEGVPRDPGVAVQWLKRAAAQGHAGAKARLAQTGD